MSGREKRDEIAGRTNENDPADGPFRPRASRVRRSTPAKPQPRLMRSAPISKARRTKTELKKRIMILVANNRSEIIDVEETILTNRIGVHLTSYNGLDRRKVHAVVLNPQSDRHIGSNARRILEERIETKSKKCGTLAFRGTL